MSTIDTALRKPRASYRYFALSILLAGVLLYFVFRGVDWAAMGTTIRQGRPGYLAVAFLLFTVSYFIRALRWRVLLSAEKRIPPLTVFWATCVGYLGNNFLPARAGEAMRAVLLGRAAAINVAYVFATALTERFMDVLALGIISLGALMSLHGMPGWLIAASRLMALVAAIGMATLLLAPRLLGAVDTAMARLPLSGNLRQGAASLLKQFLLGLQAFRHPVRAASFGALTLVIWLTDSVVAIVVGRAFDLVLTPAQALLLLAALGLSSAAPSTPGYVGIYQFVAVTVLVPFGLSHSQALVYILALQATIYSVVLVYGLVGLWQLNRQPQPVSRPSPAALPAVELQDRSEVLIK